MRYYVYEMCRGRRVMSGASRRGAVSYAADLRVGDDAPAVVAFGPEGAPDAVADVAELTSGGWSVVAKIYRAEGEK